MRHGLFEVGAPTDVGRSIPGFSEGAWRTLVRQVEEIMGEGDLLSAYQRLREIREKYSDQREVKEKADAVLRKIEAEVKKLDLTESAVLELAIPNSELTSLHCSPQEGFLLSRINGAYSLGEILKMIPGSDIENRLLLHAFMERGVVRHGTPRGQANSDTQDLFTV
jgi:hypothetical protein